jgi:hypothetical protein
MCLSHYTLHPRGTTSSQVAAEPESDGLLTAGGNRSTPLDASLLFLLHDLEDGTYALQAAQGSPRAGLFVCATLNGQGPLRAHSAAGTETCARFWLYGTAVGSYALLSAANGRFVVASGANSPLLPTVIDPRTAVADGARFLLEVQR